MKDGSLGVSGTAVTGINAKITSPSVTIQSEWPPPILVAGCVGYCVGACLDVRDLCGGTFTSKF